MCKRHRILKITRLIIVASLLFIITGCSTYTARNNNGIGHSYIATEQSYDYLTVGNAITLVSVPPMVIITLPLTIIDMGLSVVADTVMLLFDLANDPENEKRIISSFSPH